MSSTVTAPVTWIETLGQLSLPAKADERLQELMDRNNEGQLTESEKTDLEVLVELSQQMSLVRAEALSLLGRKPK